MAAILDKILNVLGICKKNDPALGHCPCGHDALPGTGNLPPEEIAKIQEMVSSNYYAYVNELIPLVSWSTVERTQAGTSGYLLYLDDGRWILNYLVGDELQWKIGSGELDVDIPMLLSSAEFGDPKVALGTDVPYGSKGCDLAQELAKSHGLTISGMAIGEKCFNYCFETGRELDTSVYAGSDGRLVLRVFWEQW